ncbi:MAG: hypothetical protein ACQEQV_00385 [Fibrobacterota bacterium]
MKKRLLLLRRLLGFRLVSLVDGLFRSDRKGKRSFSQIISESRRILYILAGTETTLQTLKDDTANIRSIGKDITLDLLYCGADREITAYSGNAFGHRYICSGSRLTDVDLSHYLENPAGQHPDAYDVVLIRTDGDTPELRYLLSIFHRAHRISLGGCLAPPYADTILNIGNDPLRSVFPSLGSFVEG